MPPSPLDQVWKYHQESKHAPGRYAPSLGEMDWQNQPNPFRSFAGCSSYRLPLGLEPWPAPAGCLFDPYGSPAPWGVEFLSRFLHWSLGLTAEKHYRGASWSLRANPSSGNLHPVEAHLLLPATPGLPAGLYHYDPLHHGLEARSNPSPELEERLRVDLGEGGFLLGLSFIALRESWKYGMRAFRYCQLDLGHALAACAMAASALGWSLRLVPGLNQAEMGGLFGLDRTPWREGEEEVPAMVLALSPQGAGNRLSPEFLAAALKLEVLGEPLPLAPSFVDWPAIAQVELATRPQGGFLEPSSFLPPLPALPRSGPPAQKLILQRRSAQAMDKKRSRLSQEGFFQLLAACLPQEGRQPFAAGLPGLAMHLALFVHQVEGLEPGLYWLQRDQDWAGVKASLNKPWDWNPLPNCPLPLALLKAGDYRRWAAGISCGQEIAGEGAFSLGMLAPLGSIAPGQEELYRHYYHQAGQIGQVLYLEAERLGLRGTGIGCYFDETFHELLGCQDSPWQSLYHFTLGFPQVDSRILTADPYASYICNE